MVILVEGEKYPIQTLTQLLDNSKFYIEDGVYGIITHVGYYHSFTKSKLVYFLPKVFMQCGRVFGMYLPGDLLNDTSIRRLKHEAQYLWARQLTYYFYKSLIEYRKRNQSSTRIAPSKYVELDSNIALQEFTYLDLLLSFVNFHKKNKQVILFYHIQHKSKNFRKVNWSRTIHKIQPIIYQSDRIVYPEAKVQRNKIDSEEELLSYFYSILNNFKHEHGLDIKVDASFQILKGQAFENLKANGSRMLRRIKHRYFADNLKKIYRLCEIYFSHNDKCTIQGKHDEYITISNYNIVFEDMIDKLFSEPIDPVKNDGVRLSDLKYNKDGKIIDHIYSDLSLIDTSDIFYIGDSKYYKPDSFAGRVSVYKQFTYAKNVIQFNVDIFNITGQYPSGVRYRDELTEGYNISPNFFVYGYLSDLSDFDTPCLEQAGEVCKSSHFANRLFDRDTLFINQFKINFLYVLKSYSSSQNRIATFRRESRRLIRNSFIDYFNNSSEFSFYELSITSSELDILIHNNFKRLNGKCIQTNTGRFIIAQHFTDNSINDILQNGECIALK